MSSSTQAPKRKSKGRQKVEMVKMENETNLQVTFSKRRAGLFKKASEICTLCAAEAAIVVFSPASKVYCFGHPNVESVTNRFLNGLAPSPTNNLNKLIFEAQRNSTIRSLNLELTQLESLFGIEKKRTEELDRVRKSDQMQQLYLNSLDQLNFTQLRCMKEAVLEFKKNFDSEVEKGMIRLSNPHLFHPNVGGNENENENPSGFSFGVGSNVYGSLPTFNIPTPMGSNDFSFNANYNSNGFGAYMSNIDPRATTSSNAPFTYDPTHSLSTVVDGYGTVTNGSNGAMFINVDGTTNGSSASVPNNIYPIPMTVPDGGFNVPHGFNNGYGDGPF